jgi:hypothetical protein
MGWEGRQERATEGEEGTEALVISVCRGGELDRSAANAHIIQVNVERAKGDSSYVCILGTPDTLTSRQGKQISPSPLATLHLFISLLSSRWSRHITPSRLHLLFTPSPHSNRHAFTKYYYS